MKLLKNTRIVIILSGFLLIFALLYTTAYGERIKNESSDWKWYRKVEYGKVDNYPLLMDIYHLKNPAVKPMPVVVWIHGGAWRGGSRSQGVERLRDLVNHGYCGVQIDYRLSKTAKWPAQIYDCKAAIRYLRAHASEYNIDPDKIGVWGSSAGGHLVSLLGTSGDVEILEGKLGWNEYSSSVNAVCSWAGPSDFTSFKDAKNLKFDPLSLKGPVGQLFGQAPSEIPEKLKQASPVTYASPDDPPFLIMNGAKDKTVPPSQGQILADALKKNGVDVTFILCPGEGHGLGVRKHGEIVLEFFNRIFSFENR
jgi:acetyl esterase/lipase